MSTTIKGTVIKVMPKTAVVSVSHLREHPIYRKKFKIFKKFKAHTEIEVKPGDMVEMVESRTYSKEKHFRVAKVLSKLGEK